MVGLRSSGPVPYPAVAGEPLASTFVARETGPGGPPKPRLPDRVREAIRARHYSRRTEKTYVAWIRRYILFHGKRHPAEMGPVEITQFLNALAVKGKVAASTQNQALSALLFLYREVLGQDLSWLDGIVRAKRPDRLPVVLTRAEVRVEPDPRAGRQGAQGSRHDAARRREGRARATSRGGAAAASARRRAWRWLGGVARRPQTEVPQRGPRVPPLVRHPPARGPSRHPHGPGTARAQRREHDRQSPSRDRGDREPSNFSLQRTACSRCSQRGR